MTAPVGDDLTWLDDLERAHAAATEGPWELDPAALSASNDSGDLLFDYRDVVLVGDVPEGVAQCRADGELIVAAVNAAPELIAKVRELDARIRAGLALADELDREGEVRLARTGMWGPAADRHLVANRLRTAITAALTPESVTT